MIKIFGNYYDRNGNKYKVVSFNGNNIYACEAIHSGKVVYLNANELIEKLPPKHEKTNFTDIAIKRNPVSQEKEKDGAYEDSSEPEYEEPKYEEPEYEEISSKISSSSKENVLKDNNEETASNDFYADF